jgi:hypothetical protein
MSFKGPLKIEENVLKIQVQRLTSSPGPVQPKQLSGRSKIWSNEHSKSANHLGQEIRQIDYTDHSVLASFAAKFGIRLTNTRVEAGWVTSFVITKYWIIKGGG